MLLLTLNLLLGVLIPAFCLALAAALPIWLVAVVFLPKPNDLSLPFKVLLLILDFTLCPLPLPLPLPLPEPDPDPDPEPEPEPAPPPFGPPPTEPLALPLLRPRFP